MGFLDAIFGKKQAEEIELNFGDIPSFVEKELAPKREELEKGVGTKFSEIKHVLKEMKASLRELEEGKVSGGSERLSKIVGTSRKQTISSLRSLLEKLVPPEQAEPAKAKAYYSESTELLQREIGQSGKSIAYTGIYLKDYMKQIGENVRELSNLLGGLGKELEKGRALFEAEKIESIVRAVEEKKRFLKSVGEETVELEKAGVDTLLKKREAERKLEYVRGSAQAKALQSLHERKAELLRKKQEKKTEMASLILPIDKPLKRFSKAVASGRYSLPKELEHVLELLKNNQSMLIKSDPKGEATKQLILELKKAVESGVVELKEREREKKISAMREIATFNFFSKVFWELNGLDAELVSLEKEAGANSVSQEITLLEKAIAEHNTLKEENSKNSDELQARIVQEEKASQALVLELETHASNVSGKKVKIRL